MNVCVCNVRKRMYLCMYVCMYECIYECVCMYLCIINISSVKL